MLCQNCNSNQATVHSTININGMISETHYCSACSIKENKSKTVFNLGDFFSNSNSSINSCDNYSEIDMCNVCGTSYDEFVSTGVLGCENCYKVFENKLIPVISSVQPDTKHVGKTHNIIAENISETEKKLKHLEFQLRQAVLQENYELASELKKTIITLRDNDNGGDDYE